MTSTAAIIREAGARVAQAARPSAPFVAPSDVVRERCRRSLRYFIREAFPHVEPGVQLTHGWYLDAIADHLEAVLRAMTGQPGGIRRLVINIQHRSLKSTVVGVLFPAWTWLRHAWIPWLTAARSQDLAIRDALKMRRLLESEFYQALITDPDTGVPAWSFTEDQKQKGDYLNTANGRRIATFRGGGTGYGGLGLIADDILSIQDAYSPVEIADANRWLEREFFTRQNDPARAAMVLNMHRLTPDDPSSVAIEAGWEHLCLPTEYDPTDRKKPTSIGFVDPRTEPGESLCPERWTPAVIADEKGSLKDLYEAIANQRPRNRAGAILKDHTDLPRWQVLPVRSRKTTSIDPSFKGVDVTRPNAKRSRVAVLDGEIERLPEGSERVYLTGLTVDFMDFNRLIAEAKAARDRQKGGVIYLEDEANGPALRNRVEDEVPGIIAVDPGNGPGSGSKLERFVAVAHLLVTTVLWPPDDYAPWVRPFVQHVLSYPSVPYDDHIDALTQLVRMVFLATESQRKAVHEREEAVARWKRLYG